MRIAFNPSTVAALTSPPNNKDITFDLRGQNIFARGVKFYGTDTNTWRDIKINNVSIGSHTLDLRNGSNTTLTNTNGIVTINSTWRPVVDNLTSNSTTSSLSANQGRVLAGLINGKSDSDHNHDGRYVKKSGDTMLGALNFANGTWNLVGDDSYMGDCNISGHFGIKAANTTYPGIAFFNNASAFLGNLTAYSGNIKYGAYSLQFLDNGNTSVSASTWTNPFSAYNSNAVADGQAICVWGQASYLSNLSTDTGDMSLWLKRVNAKAATLNMVLDGEYYANGNQRLAHISEIPTSLKNPHALTISLNGTSQGPYDGSAAKNINITPSSIGAATSDHNHDGRYVYNYGGTQMDGASRNKNALGMSTTSGISGEWWHILQAAWNYEYRWNSQIAFPTQNRNGMYYRSGLDDNTKWGSWVKLLDTNNYSSVLDSRYYTESEVDSLLDAKLNRQNLSYGTWNPRGYNLAADYYYNGGDLSISESGGQIHVSVDGYFWQNEGQYRVLDTSDVAGLKGDLTVHQYLSATDTTWWPLIWGGDSHNNTNASTGAVYKSHDKLSWQTSSQTLYATRLQTTFINLENNRGISRVTSGGTSPFKGIQLPDLQSNGVGIFSKVEEGADEGGVIISADTSVIYNSFDTGWGLTIRDKDKGQMNISGSNTIAFGVRQDYRAYSLGGFEKAGSDNSYVLLGGGGHKKLSDFAYGSNYVKAFGTSNANIDSDWGQSFKTFDPIPSGTPPEQNPNISLLSIGENFDRRKQLAFIWNNDNIYYRRHVGGGGFSNWVKLLHSGNSYVTSGKGVINGTTITQVDNAEKLGGMSKNYGQSPFGTIPCVGSDGVMEIGRYIDYHYDNSGKYDFSTRLQTTGNYANVVNLPSASGTLALISQVLTWKSQIIDMRNYSESYWHPVTVPLSNAGYNKIKVSVQLNSGDKPSWATHDSGITCNMEIWATASGWGTTDSDTICLNYTYKFCSQNPCGWMQLGKPSLGVVFLRGGSRYTVYTDFDATFTPHNQKYTWDVTGGSQDTGGPYTSCPGLNFNMGAIHADLIATMVQARRVCAGHDPGIANSISCSNWFRSSGNTGWYNTTYQGGWYMSDTSWIRAHNGVGIYTSGQIYSGSSIRMGNILLEHTDEINNVTNGGINLNYRNSGNISLCQGGGNVGIGTMSPTYKLDVNGQMRTSGFHHSSVNSDNYMLLAGGGYKSFGGDNSNPIFLGYLNLYHGNDGTISSSFLCLGYSVPFTYTRGGNYCRIYIPDTTHQVFYIGAATASVHYSGGGMDTWTGVHRGSGAWWLHCYVEGTNEIRVKGFCQNNNNNDSWWGGNPLWSGNDGANKITVCIFGYVKFR